jgi:histidinol-phosphate/aromatic aminotransferase/cobyric acid decarboxylase-like protein
MAAHRLVVDLQHLHLDAIECLARALVLQIKQIVKCPVVDASPFHRFDVCARHGVRLAAASLAVGKDAHVVAIENGADERLRLDVHLQRRRKNVVAIPCFTFSQLLWLSAQTQMDKMRAAKCDMQHSMSKTHTKSTGTHRVCKHRRE